MNKCESCCVYVYSGIINHSKQITLTTRPIAVCCSVKIAKSETLRQISHGVVFRVKLYCFNFGQVHKYLKYSGSSVIIIR